MLLGLFGTSFNFLATWLVLGLAAQSVKHEDQAPWATAFTVCAFILKWPLILGCMHVSKTLGGCAPDCFLYGLGLVYCAAIGWALARS